MVLPVPGPPVITQTLFSLIALIASFCFSDNSILDFFSNNFNSLSKLSIFFILEQLSKSINRLATYSSAS